MVENGWKITCYYLNLTLIFSSKSKLYKCYRNAIHLNPKQGSSEDDGISDVYDRSEFKVNSNCCYNNCCCTNCGNFTCIYLNLPYIPKFTWIYLNFPKFYWIYLNLPDYQNLPDFTWIYMNIHELTKIYLKIPEFILI